LGMSQHHSFGVYGYGHGHSYQPMDQPSMFSNDNTNNNNEIWAFSANGGMYDYGSRSTSGSAFDHPTPAPMSGSLAGSPIELPEAEEGFASPGTRKVDDSVSVTQDVDDDELPIDEALSDRPSCGQPEGSEDENRTITAPGTPCAWSISLANYTDHQLLSDFPNPKILIRDQGFSIPRAPFSHWFSNLLCGGSPSLKSMFSFNTFLQVAKSVLRIFAGMSVCDG
jgi:hypothetical protein